MKIRKFVLLLALLPLVGAGCFRIGPRVVRVPEAPLRPAVATTTRSTVDTEISSQGVYLMINGGSVEIKRGEITSQAQDATELASGDRLIIKSGSVTLLYPDAGESVIEAPADLQILSNGEDLNGLFAEIRLYAGTIWTRLEKLLGNEEQFSVAANGVVATVRGTAFGVTLQDDDFDIQVADHEVEVTTEDEQASFVSSTEKELIRPVMKIAAGEGLKLKAAKGVRLDLMRLKDRVRKLDDMEKARKGYLFGLRAISPDKLKRPLNPVRLPFAPMVPRELLQRLNIIKQLQIRQASLNIFMPPTRGVLDQEYVPTSTTPTTQGPTTTSMYDGLNLLDVQYQGR